jgi:hypothetical protein
MDIIIPTLIIWLISGLLVNPLAQKLTARQLNLTPGLDLKALPEEERKKVEKVFVQRYILTGIVILGIAGIVGGLLGYFFVGISWEKKSWPGMIAFILGSFLGFTARGGAA